MNNEIEDMAFKSTPELIFAKIYDEFMAGDLRDIDVLDVLDTLQVCDDDGSRALTSDEKSRIVSLLHQYKHEFDIRMMAIDEL